MFIESKTWGGYPDGEMAEVYSRIGPSLGHSPRSDLPPKEKRKTTNTDRLRGVIKFYNTEKHFGFIAVKGGPDLFFHLSDFENLNTAYLMPGDRVTFEIGEDKRGRVCAKNVRLSQ